MAQSTDHTTGSSLAQRAIAAHGGLELWRGADAVRAEISSGGFAFASKLQGSAIRSAKVSVETRGQRVVFEHFPREGSRGILEANGTVTIESGDAGTIASRANARAAFSDLRHQLWWNRLDILYFAACAMWTYMSCPFVFADEGYELTELGPWQEDGRSLERLRVRFPEHIHTHCREQVFYIDESGVIRRHDYTAETVGGWAHAAHYCQDHERFDGLLVPTVRRVYPRRGDGRKRPHPRLVWIDVADAGVSRAES